MLCRKVVNSCLVLLTSLLKIVLQQSVVPQSREWCFDSINFTVEKIDSQQNVVLQICEQCFHFVNFVIEKIVSQQNVVPQSC